MRLNPSSFIIVCFASLFLFAAIEGCSKETEAKPAPAQREPVAVSVAPIATQSVQRAVEVVGTLYGDEETTISAKVPGRITTIHNDVGDRCAPGEPLAQIERTDYELAQTQQRMAMQESLAKLGLSELPPGDFDPAKVPLVARARLQAQNSESKFRRGEKLFRQTPPLLSEQDFADLRTAFDVARSNHDVELLSARAILAEAATRRSELALATQRLADTTVRAPAEEGGSGVWGRGSDVGGGESEVGGGERDITPATATSNPRPTTHDPRVSAPGRYAIAVRQVSVGEYVREGTAMFRLVAADPIKFRAAVPERFAAQVRIGQQARVSVEAYQAVFTGAIARINPQVDFASRAFQVEITVHNADGKLQPGGFARGSILTYTDDHVVFVPTESVVTFAGVSKVFTIADGKAVDHTVRTGVSIDGQVEIVTGLKAGGEVVVAGAAKLAGGVAVTTSPRDKLPTATTRPTNQPNQ